MNTALFKNWLIQNKCSNKVASDYVSRLKRVDNLLININSSIDQEYSLDKCETLLASFKNNGVNKIMEKYQFDTLPIGKAHIRSYKLSIKKFVDFKKNVNF